MGWQDRDYNNRIGDMRFGNPFLNLLFGSVPLGTVFGIRVRLHSTFIIFIVIELLLAGARNGLGLALTAFNLFVLFSTVLLHEFGHCFGARAVRGDANEILLWPLGGLAYANAPHRPWPTFVTVAAGPLVNVIICIITGVALSFMIHFEPAWLSPLNSFSGGLYIRDLNVYRNGLLGPEHLIGWLWAYFSISISLFFFNLLPIFPLDGGQMLQTILWKPLGYRKSMNFACITGMIGAAVGFIAGLYSGSGLLAFLAIGGFMTCYQRRMILKMTPEEDEDPYDLSAAWENPDRPSPRKKKIKKRWLRSVRRKASRDQAEQAKIDAILAKVKEKGLHSLTWWEKRTLKKATERQRQRDLANRL